jgi:hypothetical protein
MEFIKANQFSERWKEAKYERGEAQTFWNEFFSIFEIDRKRVASFEEPVKKLGGKQGYIDLFWRGKLLIEHKSLGKDLGKAKTQAIDYFPNLKDEELPRYILVCDFQNFELYDLVEDREWKFELSQLSEKLHLFDFLIDDTKKSFDERIELNLKAGYLIGDIHDELQKSGYFGKDLEIFLVRQLFLLFADSTDIWNKNLFLEWFDTSKDPHFLGGNLALLFQVLNTPIEKRSKNLDDLTKRFPYVNGDIFKENLPIAFFDEVLKNKFLEALRFDWSQINPVIFGSIFQASMDKDQRAELGSHFTSENNILRAIEPLFLKDLRDEFQRNIGNRKELEKLQQKIANLKFLDPACGSGNFLIVAFRKLKELEIDIIREINTIPLISIEQFYGFEIDELPAKITEMAMLLIDHQMNRKIEKIFGKADFNIPIKRSANIYHINSLQRDWNETLNYQKVDYIFGNPPFLGARVQNANQKEDMRNVFDNVKGFNNLDYVSAWFLKSADYMELNPKTETAFVSTNSIVQGEQVSTLWGEIVVNMGLNINFAHQTFKWKNEAKNNAQVHCVIVGFGKENRKEKYIFEYPDLRGEPHRKVAKKINQYLIEGETPNIINRKKHIQKDALEMMIGNKPIDGGNYIFSEDEKNEFLQSEPKAEKFFREFLGAREFLNREKRYILFLKDASPKELKSMPKVLERVENVRKLRLNSNSKPTQILAETPTKYHIETFPENSYLVLPETSSEFRKYIPIGFVEEKILVSNSIKVLPNASLYHFGILTSSIHMDFMRYVAGRLKSDYRYSIGIVYNNFPFPENVLEKERKNIEKLSKNILEVREKFGDSSLSDLYNINSMPSELLKAHKNLDLAVDKLYNGGKSFKNGDERVAKIFEIHNELTKDLISDEKKIERKRTIKREPLKVVDEVERKSVQANFEL